MIEWPRIIFGVVLIAGLTVTINSAVWAFYFYCKAIALKAIEAGYTQEVLPGQTCASWVLKKGE